MLCEKLVDTPVRGLLYEGAGTLADDVLAGGAEIVRAAAATWNIPVEVLATPPAGLRRVDRATRWRRSSGCSRDDAMDRATLSAITHRGVPFANPLPPAAIDEAIAALRLPDGARALDVGCGAGELLARLAARHPLRTEGIEPAAEWAAAARARVDVVHEAPFAEVTLEHGGYDLVCCLASSHAIGSWERVAARAGRAGAAGRRARARGRGLLAARAERRLPRARSAGRAPTSCPSVSTGWRRARATRAGRCSRARSPRDADWARYEETLLANGEAELALRPDPDLRAWVDAARARWEGEGGQGHDGLRAADAAAS